MCTSQNHYLLDLNVYHIFIIIFLSCLGRPQGMTLCLHDRLYVCLCVCVSALINYANLCKICQSVNILVYTFLHFGIHFFISLYLCNTATDRVYFWHACTLGPGLYSPNVFGDAALINYANLCKFSQNHIKCSYFLISLQILFKFGIQIYYSFFFKS